MELKKIPRPVVWAIALAALLSVLALAMSAAATQDEDIVEGYYTVAWEIPGPEQFPQTLAHYAYMGEVKDLDWFDHLLDECKRYQVDIYNINSPKDVQTLVDLIAKGTLERLDNGLPEDNKIWHSSKIVEAATDCTPETTTTTEATTTTTTQETTTTSVGDTTSTTTVDGSSTTSTVVATTVTEPPLVELPFTGPFAAIPWDSPAVWAGMFLLLLSGVGMVTYASRS